jgi:cytochrome c oxidase subunit III
MTMQGSIPPQSDLTAAALGLTSSTVTSSIEAQAHDHGEEHHDFRIFGLLMFLVAEAMIFLGLFAAYLTFRSVNAIPADGIPERELLLPGINTLILVASSFVIHKAEDAIKEDDVKGLQKWFGITAAMGAVFLVGQMYEYFGLSFGLKTSLYASTFYVLTGFHGLHVLVGLLTILAVLWRSREAGHYTKEQRFGIEAAEIYWHFVDVVWIVLFILLYLL